MITPIEAVRALRGTCGALKEWIRGRYRLAREREDRATAYVVFRELESGGVWLDRDGDRLRLVMKPFGDTPNGTRAQLERVKALVQLEQGDGKSTDR